MRSEKIDAESTTGHGFQACPKLLDRLSKLNDNRLALYYTRKEI